VSIPRTVVLLVTLVLLVAGCGDAASPAPSAGDSASPSAGGASSSWATDCPPAASVIPATLPWWNDRVFYEIFVRSFQDSDGDGIGDLRGVVERLDYLNDGDPATTDDLGVTGIWLMPVFEAASYHGYDVLDYRAVERDYGSTEDLRALVEAAHERGIAVIVDLVVNHTSVDHPWFGESRQAGSPKDPWYVWSDTDPGYGGPGGEQVWYPLDGRWYYALFWEGMPDLDLRDGDVTAELHDIARSWIRDAGIDGYRLDAVKHYVEDGQVQENTPESRAWAAGLGTAVHEASTDAVMVGEVWDLSSIASAYVREGSLDLAFEFELADAIKRAVRLEDSSPLIGVQRAVLADYPAAQYATFLSNHDQTRTLTEVGGDVGAARVAASLLMTGPGVPFVYYGEELGQSGRKPDERLRAPMAWTALPPAGGFSTVAPWEPMNDDWPDVNVAEESGDANSLLAHYRQLIRLRASLPALRGAETWVVDTSDPAVVATLRRSGDQTLLVLVNLSSAPAADVGLTLDAGPLCGTVRAAPVATDEAPAPPVALGPLVTAGGGFAGYVPVAELPPRSLSIWQLEPASP